MPKGATLRKSTGKKSRSADGVEIITAPIYFRANMMYNVSTKVGDDT